MTQTTQTIKTITEMITKHAATKTGYDPDDIYVDFRIGYIAGADRPIRLSAAEIESCLEFVVDGTEVEDALRDLMAQVANYHA